ncbi:transmembrane protein 134 isoform X2 [Rhinatrema bivittatum]|uniref:transmembrane protein 134 isoform X2 n=1 Tax=Rhinatrema bivittatum TaxID=194408 RepID=UPI0011298C32|nr:transmembrane protein 134 isoform X2 [Rhinatrema bivittatum]
MSAAVRPGFSIDDAFELSLEEREDSVGAGTPRFGTLHFDRKGKSEDGEDGEKQSRLKYQNLENDEENGPQLNGKPPDGVKVRDPGRSSTRSSQWSFSTISNTTQLSYRECFSWTQHPLIQKNWKVVLASFILLLLGIILVLVGVGLLVNPSQGISSAIFFVPGFLLLIPGVYHVIFIYCAVKGRKGFQFFYLPYFEK